MVNDKNFIIELTIFTIFLIFSLFSMSIGWFGQNVGRKKPKTTSGIGSKPLEKLKQLAHTFPDNFILFGTYFLDELAACSVTIKLSKTVIYQFYWAHKQSFADKNPLLFHNYQVACKAKEEGFKILDFGTSSVDGIINRGLFRYKKHLGAKQSKKYYLTYQFWKTRYEIPKSLFF